MLQAIDSADLKIVQRARAVLLEHGYSRLTMTMLAQACGLSRRGLYHHFNSKEDVFRAILRLGNHEAVEAADWAAHTLIARGASVLDVVAKWLDTRFGETRRAIGRSAHGEELNSTAFSIGHDIVIEVSRETNVRLTRIIADLDARGMLTLRPGVAAADAASLIADGARGINQARPFIPASRIAASYRRITEAILFGCAHEGPAPQNRPAAKKS